MYSHRSPNNCAYVENSNIILISDVVNIDGSCFISGTKLLFVNNLYESPYPSSALGIGYYTSCTTKVHQVKPVTKCILIPIEDQYLFIPYCNMTYCG